jgi:hypothetical protein
VSTWQYVACKIFGLLVPLLNWSAHEDVFNSIGPWTSPQKTKDCVSPLLFKFRWRMLYMGIYFSCFEMWHNPIFAWATNKKNPTIYNIIIPVFIAYFHVCLLTKGLVTIYVRDAKIKLRYSVLQHNDRALISGKQKLTSPNQVSLHNKTSSNYLGFQI